MVGIATICPQQFLKWPYIKKTRKYVFTIFFKKSRNVKASRGRKLKNIYILDFEHLFAAIIL